MAVTALGTISTLDTKTSGTPGWWLVRLEQKLAERCKRYDLLERYYTGDHPLPEGDDRMRDLFRKFQRKSRTNYMRLVADSVAERLEIVGFRAGGGSNVNNDADAWRIWQSNHLDADSSMAHTTASKFADVYVIVGPPDDDGTDDQDNPDPIITIEDPRTVIVETDPINRRVVRAAAKIWIDEADGKRHAVVYLKDAFYYFEAELKDPQVAAGSVGGMNVSSKITAEQELVTWRPEIIDEEGDDADESFDSDPDDKLIGSRVLNPVAPVVPVVRLIANPGLDGEGMCEFEDVIDVQDRINDTVMNRLVVAKMQAYRQRWAKGIQSEDEDGNELPLPFVPGVDLLWAVEETDATFGDFAQSDLAPFLLSVADDVKAIVTLTGLPPHYVSGDIVNASADALAAAETRLVSKVRARARGYGESWEEVLRLAFMYLGQPDHIGVDAEVIWTDPERQSVSQLADAAVKKQAAGVPWRQRMVDLKYSPTEIDQMDADRAADALLSTPVEPQFPAPSKEEPTPSPPVVAPPLSDAAG